MAQTKAKAAPKKVATKAKYKLVIVESPAKAKTIGKFLGSTYRVQASNGHVRDLPKSQIGVDVENGFEPKYITIRGRSEALSKIRKDAKGASAVYLATDPDREGEAIAWHLAQALDLPAGQKNRITFNEITKTAIKQALGEVREIEEAKVDAQQARRVLDRLVGYKISPLLWSRVRKRLSAGRVQSAVTWMICDREKAVQAFVPRQYYTLGILAHTQKSKALFPLQLVKGKSVLEFDDEAQAQKVLADLGRQDALVKSVVRSQRMQNAQPPFTTSSMQQEASRKLSFTTKRTMMVAQQLYEGVDIAGSGTVGLVSYIRTDSVRVSQEAIEAVRNHIFDTFGPAYLPPKPNVYKGRKNAQDAHEAIRPTNMALTPESVKASLTPEQFKLYRLIYSRFLGSQMSPVLFDTIKADIAADKYALRYAGEAVAFQGYRAAYTESAEDEVDENAPGKMVALEEGQTLTLSQVEVKEHETQPPARYTEATLVRALEQLGIGRPSTYAPIIATILERGYVRRQGKTLMPTPLGDIVTDIMVQHFPEIADVAFTAGMEEELDEIEEGQKTYLGVLKEFYGPFEKNLEKAEATMETVKIEDEVSDVVCEKCGKLMVYKLGRFGKFLACPGFPACRNTKNITVKMEAPCPKCGGNVVARKTKTGRTFYGCEKYPECDFRSWDMPIKEKCPVCGGPMVQKQVKGVATGKCMDPACSGTLALQKTNE